MELYVFLSIIYFSFYFIFALIPPILFLTYYSSHIIPHILFLVYDVFQLAKALRKGPYQTNLLLAGYDANQGESDTVCVFVRFLSVVVLVSLIVSSSRHPCSSTLQPKYVVEAHSYG